MFNSIEEARVFAKRTVFDVFPKYNIILAGGAIRDFMCFGQVKNDFDIYFYCENQMNRFRKEFLGLATDVSKYGFHFEVGGLKYHAITFMTTESTSDLIDTFDFSINGVAISKIDCSVNKKYLEDIDKMIISDIIMPHRDTALYRLVHFMEYGFKPTKEAVYAVTSIMLNNKINRKENGDISLPNIENAYESAKAFIKNKIPLQEPPSFNRYMPIEYELRVPSPPGLRTLPEPSPVFGDQTYRELRLNVRVQNMQPPTPVIGRIDEPGTTNRGTWLDFQ